MSFQDKSLQCSDCGATFTFSAGEQEFFQSRGYTNEPKRCPSCRSKEDQSVTEMATISLQIFQQLAPIGKSTMFLLNSLYAEYCRMTRTPTKF